MMNINENPYNDIDAENSIERKIDGCEVRLLFSLKNNEKNKRLVLDNLMLAFDRKMQGLQNVQAQ